MTLHKGKIYLLSNSSCWKTLKKIGVSENPSERIKQLQTGLPDDIQIMYESDIFVDKYFYEHLLSKILFKYRYRKDKEFYNIEINDFIQLTTTMEIINKMNDTEDKLMEFIKNFDNEYYNRRFKKIKNRLFVCT